MSDKAACSNCSSRRQEALTLPSLQNKNEPANERFAKCGVGLRPASSGNLWFPDTSRLNCVSGGRALREAGTGRSETCPTPPSLATGAGEFVGFMPHDSRARILPTSVAT